MEISSRQKFALALSISCSLLGCSSRLKVFTKSAKKDSNVAIESVSPAEIGYSKDLIDGFLNLAESGKADAALVYSRPLTERDRVLAVSGTSDCPEIPEGVEASSLLLSDELYKSLQSFAYCYYFDGLLHARGTSVSVDLLPPGAPDVSGPSYSNTQKPTWSWIGSEPLLSYRLWSDDTGIAEFISSASSFTPQDPMRDGIYRVNVTSLDLAGNESTPTVVTTVIDTKGPEVGIDEGIYYTGPLDNYVAQVGGACSESGLLVALRGKANSDAGCVGGVWQSSIGAGDWEEGRHQISVTQADLAKNETTIFATVVKDGTSPQISGMQINNGASSTNKRKVQIKVTAADSGAGVAKVRFSETLTTCDLVYRDLAWQAWPQGLTEATFAFNLSLISGDKVVCGWVKDHAGNVSIPTNSGNGTSGMDRNNISLQLDPPATITSLVVTNHSVGSGTTFAVGDKLKIEWTVEAPGGLSENPLQIIEYTTDGKQWAKLAPIDAVASSYGSTMEGSMLWSSSYTSGIAPTNLPFVVRLTFQSQSGTLTQAVSDFLNGDKWSFWAGNLGTGDGASANAADVSLSMSNSIGHRFLVSHKTGDIWLLDTGTGGVRRIDAENGTIELVIPNEHPKLFGSTLPHRSNTLAQDSLGFIYFQRQSADGLHTIERFDPSDPINTLQTYCGGGTQHSGTFPPNQLAVITLGHLAFDQDDNLYLFTGSNVDQHTRSGLATKLAKVSREGTIAGQVSIIAGDVPYSASPFTEGELAVSQPLVVPWPGITSIAMTPDGSTIYLSYHWKTAKLVSGRIYSTNLPNTVTLLYNPFDSSGKQFYYANSVAAGAIRRFAATLTTGGEVFEDLYGGGTGAGCDEDGVLTSASCLIAAGGLSLSASGQMFFADGLIINTPRSNRIRTISGGKVWTVAGQLSTIGIGGDRKRAKFLGMGHLARDSQNNIFIADAYGQNIFKVANGSNLLNQYVGGGSFIGVPAPNQPLVPQSLGGVYSGGDSMSIAVGSDDMLYLRAAGRLHYADGGGLLQTFGTGSAGNYWTDLETGDLFPATGQPLYVDAGRNNIAADGNGNLYFSMGSQSNVGKPGPRIMKVNTTTQVVTFLAGMQTSVDIADRGKFTPDGQPAEGSSLRCNQEAIWSDDGNIGNCLQKTLYLRAYDNKLFFSEWDRIRVLSQLDGTDLLETLKDGDGNPITDFIQPVSNFLFLGDRIYYNSDPIKNTQLYCRWKGTAATMPADCNNSALSLPQLAAEPPRGFPGSLIEDENGDVLYSTSRTILRYDTP